MDKMAEAIKAAMLKKKSKEPEVEEIEVTDKDAAKQHLKEVAKDILDAIKQDDSDALADLLAEAMECCKDTDEDSE